MLSTVGAWAQTEVADVNTLSNDKAYMVQCFNTQWWTFNSSVPSMMSNTQTAGQTHSNENTNEHFAFLNSGENLYLYSIAAKKFVNKNGSATALVEYPEHTIQILASSQEKQGKGYPHVVSLNGSHLGVSTGYSGEQGVITFYNDLNDGGNAIKIVELSNFNSADALAKIALGLGSERNALLASIAKYTALYNEMDNKEDEKVIAFKASIDAAIQATSSNTSTVESLKEAENNMRKAWGRTFLALNELQNGVAYRIKNLASLRYMTVVNETTTGVQIKDYSEAVNQLFFITKSVSNDEYYNIQCCSGKYVTALSSWDVQAANTAYDFNISAPDVDGIYKIKRTDSGHEAHFVGPNNGTTADASPLYSNHGNSNGNCEWVFEAVDLEKIKLSLVEKKSKISFEPIGAVGICSATDDQKTRLEDGLASLNSLAKLIEYNSLLDEVLATSKPMSAGLYYIKGTGDLNDDPVYNSPNKEWYASYYLDGDTYKMKAFDGVEKLGADYIWSIEQNETAYKLKQVNVNAYAKLLAAGATSTIISSEKADGDEFTFEHQGNGKFIIKSGDNVVRTESDGRINHWDAETKETWYVISATELDITIGEAGYATTYLPFDVTLPNTVKAYAVTETSASTATMTVKEDIPANTGAILEGQGTHTLTIAEASSDWTGNKLLGSNVATKITGPGYVLSKVDGVVALYAAALTDGKFLNNANKAYLPAAGNNARALVFSFGDTETAIESVEGENENAKAVVYDLAGRRVQNAQKGVFIVNGKVVIK